MVHIHYLLHSTHRATVGKIKVGVGQDANASRASRRWRLRTVEGSRGYVLHEGRDGRHTATHKRVVYDGAEIPRR